VSCWCASLTDERVTPEWAVREQLAVAALDLGRIKLATVGSALGASS